jgi:hypothetical protein
MFAQRMVVCDSCQCPIPADETLGGTPIYVPWNEPICLDCWWALETTPVGEEL